ncbi:Rv1733c family protein [Streptomyces sp. NPDC002520]
MTRTPPTTVTRVRLWRWKRNPLKRHCDVVEAWIVLATWLLAVAAGVFTGQDAAHSMDATFSARRAEVHPVSAVLTEAAARTTPTDNGYEDGRVWAAVRWTAADGTVHTDRAKVVPGTAAGTPVTVWADGANHMVSPPASKSEAMLQTVLAGVLVAQVAGTTVWAGGRLVRARLVRRRLAEWDEEWRRVEPEWRNLSGGRG